MKLFFVMLAALVLAGCNSTPDSRRGLAPQSASLLAATESAGAKASSAVLIRIFKSSNELELWRRGTDNKYRLVKTYAICAYSGTLGPKFKTGDRQAPEGFYTVTAAQLNYNSSRFLSFDTGFPNTFDRSWGRTGAYLMVHGGCDSAGCYAIEDQPMQELFTAMRDAFKAGQKQVQVHIFPFRMTDLNMLGYKSNQHYSFWQQLKPGYDRFNTTRQDLSISVVNKKYLIN